MATLASDRAALPRAAALAVALAAACDPAADAAQWSVDGTLGARTEFADNPRLMQQSEGSAAGAVIEASALLARRSERTSVQLQPRAIVREFTGDYALSGVDAGADLTASTASERWSTSGGLGYFADSTSSGGFGTTGYTETDVPRTTSNAWVQSRYQFTPQQSVFGRAGFDRVEFEDGMQAGLLDYDYASAVVYTERAQGERAIWRVVARTGLMHVPLTGVDSQDVALGLGFEYDLDERWHVALDAGPSRTVTDGVASDVGASYRTSLAGQWLLSRLELRAERVASPTAGRGVLETRDEAGVSLSHRFGDRWSAEGGASVAHYSRDPVPGYPLDSRTYARAYAAVQWQLSDEWSCRASAAQERQEADATGAGNRVMLGCNWNGRVGAVSR